MTVADLLCGAALLPAIGVLASTLKGARSAANQEANVSDSAAEGSEGQPALDNEVEVLRSLHQVRLVDEAQEGTPVTRLPSGLYGFTYSPLQSSPLFRDKKAQSFEVHKLPDECVHLVGFVTEEAARASGADEQLDLHLYPDPFETAFTAISIPASRILRSRGPSRSDGNPIILDLVADTETVQ